MRLHILLFLFIKASFCTASLPLPEGVGGSMNNGKFELKPGFIDTLLKGLFPSKNIRTAGEPQVVAAGESEPNQQIYQQPIRQQQLPQYPEKWQTGNVGEQAQSRQHLQDQHVYSRMAEEGGQRNQQHQSIPQGHPAYQQSGGQNHRQYFQQPQPNYQQESSRVSEQHGQDVDQGNQLQQQIDQQREYYKQFQLQQFQQQPQQTQNPTYLPNNQQLQQYRERKFHQSQNAQRSESVQNTQSDSRVDEGQYQYYKPQRPFPPQPQQGAFTGLQLPQEIPNFYRQEDGASQQYYQPNQRFVRQPSEDIRQPSMYAGQPAHVTDESEMIPENFGRTVKTVKTGGIRVTRPSSQFTD